MKKFDLELVQHKPIDRALDHIYDVFHQESGLFGEERTSDEVVAHIDEVLATVPLDGLPSSVAVCFYLASFLIADRLQQRDAYRTRCVDHLTGLGMTDEEAQRSLPRPREVEDEVSRDFCASVGRALRARRSQP